MCGRYVSTKSSSDLLEEFDAEYESEPSAAAQALDFPPDYNVAPTKTIRLVLKRPPRSATKDAGQDPAQKADADAKPKASPPVRQLRLAYWGLVPSWAKDRSVGAKLINARAESLADKPAFRNGFAKRRCLIPADGWYEWLRTNDAAGKPLKQPFFMTPPDGRSVALAGLYEFWKPKDAAPEVELLLSATIVTVAAQGALAEIHERMPLVLDPGAWDRWLDPSAPGPAELLEPPDEAVRDHLELRAVSSEVNNVKHNSAGLLTPVTPPAAALELF
jgi:putative SOS response-associated peptidase YedK